MKTWLVAILSLQILTIESAWTHSAANLECLQLLAIYKQSDKGIDLMSAQTQSAHISPEAQTFLNLFKVGLDNISSERPALTQNIQSTLASPRPVNPFLNLTSQLARALAGKVEILLPQLGDEWLSLQVHLAAQSGEATRSEVERQKDRAQTRTVRGGVLVPVADENWIAGAPVQLPLAYIGQTQAAYLFADRKTANDGGKVYRLSKKDNSFVSIAQIPNWLGSSFVSRWMHNGKVFGWTFFEAGSGSHTVRLFRLDPESKEVTWAEPWHDWNHIAHRVNANNTVVGFRIHPRRDSGENGQISVFRFDYDLLSFVPTDLEFDGVTMDQLPDLQPYAYSMWITGGADDPPITIGKQTPKLFKTDGKVLASPSGSGALHWEKWTPSDIVKATDVWNQPDALVEVTIQRRNVDHSRISDGLPDQDLPDATEPIHFFHNLYSWENGGRSKGNHTFELFDRGLPDRIGHLDSILYLYRTDEMSEHTHLFAIDRERWQRIPIELKGGPALNQFGKFEFVRNQRDESLLKFHSPRFTEIALWKFDPQNLWFELQAHEVMPEGFVSGQDAQAFLFDYETKQFIAWIFVDSLLVIRDVDLSAGEGSP